MGRGPLPPQGDGPGVLTRRKLESLITGHLGSILPVIDIRGGAVLKPLPDRSTGHQGMVVQDGGHGVGRGRQVQYEQMPVAVGFQHHRVPGEVGAANTVPADRMIAGGMPGATVKALEDNSPPVKLVRIGTGESKYTEKAGSSTRTSLDTSPIRMVLEKPERPCRSHGDPQKLPENRGNKRKSNAMSGTATSISLAASLICRRTAPPRSLT